jgi:flavin reductase (DIM6/NTAB) family NADH-FMN oxidoreductase RutF
MPKAQAFDTLHVPPLRCRGTPLAREKPCITMTTRKRIPRPALGQREFRMALAQFTTGVTIITARASHGFVGFTANSFNSVSLEPPLVIWSLSLRSRSLASFEATERYAVNVLARDQIALARRFSRPHQDRFAGVQFRLDKTGAPLIEGCAAWLECRHHALHPAGDHMLFIGEVLAAAHRSVPPLLWHGGRYRVGNLSAPKPRGKPGSRSAEGAIGASR